MQTLTVISKTFRCHRWFGRFDINSPSTGHHKPAPHRPAMHHADVVKSTLHGRAFIPLDKLRCF
jgi:hypothetical protein